MSSDVRLFLIGALVATRLVALLLRGAARTALPYVGLLAADLIALVVARSLGHEDGALAFVAECAGLVLALAPDVIDGLEARWGRHGTARAKKLTLLLARIREIVVPGPGSTAQRRALEDRGLTEGGGVERVIARLREEVANAAEPEDAERAYAEFVTVELEAGRLADGLSHAQRHLPPKAYIASPRLTSAMCAALLEVGHVQDALAMLILLERHVAAVDLPAVQLLLYARLCFVAGAATPATTERVLTSRALGGSLPAPALARLQAIAAAAAARTPVEPEPAALAEDLASRLLQLSAQGQAPIWRRAPATLLLICINVAVFGVVLAIGLGEDDLGLARAGALFRPAILAGEWWRLLTATFLHANLLHLGVNMYGLFVLGRLAEGFLGGARLLIAYVLAALGGSLASVWVDAGLSVGASGALMGVLAALTVVVFVRRRSFQRVAHRAFLGALVFMGVLQAFIGLQLPMIDSAAHAGGFVFGLVATAGLVPSRDAPAPRALGAIALLLMLGCCAAGVLQARRPIADTLLRLPTATLEMAGTKLEVPRAWRKESATLLVDPHLGLELSVLREGDHVKLGTASANDPRARPLFQRIAASAHPASQTP